MRRLILMGAGVAAAALVGIASFQLTRPPEQPTAQVASSDIGGPFQLLDQNGRTVTDRDLRGKPSLVFFGFTYCPEVCPTTLTHMSAWLKALGSDADKLNAVYVTVDPERDTPQQLKQYLSAFDPRIRGLTGTPQQIAQIAKEYRVYYQKIPLENGNYTMDHSAMVYMMDAKGRFVGPIGYNEPDAKVLPLLRDLVRG
jgi:protein SCO1/2